MFSQTAEYALRAMAHLAARRQETSTIPEIAERTQVPPQYLRKVLNRLRDAQIIETQRGSGGGVRLKADPKELTILQVINAVDPVEQIAACPIGRPSHLRLCPLHSEVDDAIAQLKEVLSRRTISELLSSDEECSVRCDFPCNGQQEVYEL